MTPPTNLPLITSSTPPTSLTRQTILEASPNLPLPPSFPLANPFLPHQEDTYTSSLSHIIKRDFFPTLDRLTATNAYLAALESEDPHAIADSIRGLGALTPADAGGRGEERYRREREVADMQGTPFISRTPFGGGMETPVPYTHEAEDPEPKRRRVDVSSGLDVSPTPPDHCSSARTNPRANPRARQNFQATHTSEDNSSFMDILHHENRLKREKYAWAYAAEARAKRDRLRAEQGRRRLLIEAGGFVPDDGLVTGSKAMAPPTHRLALKPVEEGSGARAIEVGPAGKREDEKAESSNSLVRRDDEAEDRALVRRAPGLNVPDISSTQLTIPNALPADATTPIDTDDDGNSTLHEIPLDPASHLARALAQVGLPETAIVTRKGELVPAREVASGSGDGLGRGEADRQEREERERRVMGDEKDLRETLVPTWRYKARNALMFGPDADVNPVLPGPRPALTAAQLRADPPEIRHVNTRLAEEEEDDGDAASRRASSPSRSRVAAAIAGKQYQPSSSLPKYGDYALVPAAPSPSPSDLGPNAIKELMTWGTLLGTPRALGGADDAPLDLTPNNFKISEPGRRDDIGRRLATNASRNMRERAQGFGTTPKGLAVLSGGGGGGERTRGRAGSMRPPAVPSPGATTPRRRAEALTPAGRTLLQRSVLGTPERSGGLGLPRSAGTRSRGEVMERAGGWRSSGASRPAQKRTWTPSPAPHRS